MADSILLSIDDGVATVTLNRPDKLNAFADDMRERLIAVLDQVASRADARVLVITGAGRGFCAGGDVRYMHALRERQAGFQELSPLLEGGRAVVTRIEALPIPSIAAINGVAAGAGASLALACDLRVASDAASFGLTFARIGLHPDWGATYALPRIVGLARALEMSWLGDMIDAPEMLRAGIVNHVWPAVEFGERVATLARRLAAAPRNAVRHVRQSMRASGDRTLNQCLDAEVAAQMACWKSPDVSEGLAAFVGKRTPEFDAPALEFAEAGPSSAARRFE